MIPKVPFAKQDFNTGVVRPGLVGVLAIVAASATGTLNQPELHVDADVAKTGFSWGPLVEYAAYVMPQTQKGCLLVRPATTTSGAYSTITKVGGTSVVTAGGTQPYDDFEVLVTFLVGATIGVAGATYTYSLDNGKTTSAAIALGTANTLVIPNTNITLNFAAGTVIAGETISFTTKRPLMTNADLPAALDALKLTTTGFEAVLIDMPCDDTTVSLLAAWILDLNTSGRFPVVFATCRPMAATGESEAQYATALATMFAASACVDLVLCAEECDMVSKFRGVSQIRPVGLPVAARSMSIPIGVEPAYVALGPLPGVSIADARGNPRHHNEVKYPGLDDLRLTVLRTIEEEIGVFINNTNLLSPTGSDFVFLPHARTMNAACRTAHKILKKELSIGVAKNPEAGPSGERYIADHAAQALEGRVQDAIDPVVKGSVDDLKFRISRTDDIRSNAGAKVKCYLESVALAYVKEFDVFARYVKQIAPAAQ